MYQRVLVPLDGSPLGQQALNELPRIAAEHGLIRLLYVVENIYPLDAESMVMFDYSQLQAALKETGQRVLQAAAAQLNALPLSVETVLVDVGESHIAEAIQQQADSWGADLIVMTTHGRSGLSRLLLGSVTEGVLRSSHIPILLLHEATKPKAPPNLG